MYEITSLEGRKMMMYGVFGVPRLVPPHIMETPTPNLCQTPLPLSPSPDPRPLHIERWQFCGRLLNINFTIFIFRVMVILVFKHLNFR